MLYLGIDLGSYLCRFVLIKSCFDRDPKIIFDKVKVVNFGKVKPGMLITSAAKLRVEKAFESFSDYIKSADKIYCFATAALRNADKADEFISSLEEKFGVNVEIISPKKEIFLASLGCKSYFNKRSIILDVGSGSTEIALVEKTNSGIILVKKWISLNLGLGNNKSSNRGAELKRFETLIKSVKKTGFLLFSKCSILKTAYLYHHKKEPEDGAVFDSKSLTKAKNDLKKLAATNSLKYADIAKKRSALLKSGLPWISDLVELSGFEKIIIAEKGVKEGMLESMLNETKRSASVV